MCRIMSLAFTSEKSNLVDLFIDAFIKASRYDPYLERLSSEASHGDGWGIASISFQDNKPHVYYYKSADPVYTDTSEKALKSIVNDLKKHDYSLVIIHARKASSSEPVGEKYSHPFYIEVDGLKAWFIHNGSADKKILGDKLGLDPRTHVDSELLGRLLVLEIDKCLGSGGVIQDCVYRAYSVSKEYILEKSALNTSLLISRNTWCELYTSHWVKNPGSDARREYYSIIAYETRGFTASGSITIKNYLPGDVKAMIKVLEPGIYNLTPEGISRIFNL